MISINKYISEKLVINKNAGKIGYMYFPKTKQELQDIIEQRIKEAKPISQMLDEKMTLEEIALDITGDVNLKKLDDEIEPKYKCDCSKEKQICS